MFILKRIALFVAVLGMALMVQSCGEKHDASGVAKRFLKESLRSPGDLSGFKAKGLDSTAMVSDKAIEIMRRKASASDELIEDIGYADRKDGSKLLILKAEYELGDSMVRASFYINKEMDGVVAFKTN